jgi:hypothetical protein
MNTCLKPLAAVALICSLSTSEAFAQSGHPFLFARQAKTQAVRAEPAPGEQRRIVPDRSNGGQRGDGQGADGITRGQSGGAIIFQRGSANAGSISQDGTNNAAAIYQLGRNNSGAITQTGANNSACILQIGRNNTASVIQTINQSVGIAQTPRGTFEFPAVLCQLHGGDPQQLRRAVMAGL